MSQVNVGLCGLGTVGTGVVKLLKDHADEIKYKVGSEINIKKILVHNLEKERDVAIEREWLTSEPSELVDHPEIDIIIEVMGGIEDTNLLLERAIQNKKHIVTANKDLMAVHGQKLLRLAKENDCDIFYDASVAGGIPIIRSLTDGLASDRIQKIMGIVNGTTNYILTKMTDEELAYEPVLKEAQALGFAEADPTSDVDGLDAARKMTLLANLSFKMEIDLDDVEVTGIRNISQEDITFATSLGYTIKLIGIASIHHGKAEVSVEPTLLPKDHPLALVKNEYNAVYVHGEAVGETMFYGPGAGSMPTATAVVSDLMEAVKNSRLGISGTGYVTPQFEKQLKEDNEKYMQYFIRMEVDDAAGTFQKITNVFTDEDISFAKILQLPSDREKTAEIVMVTHKISKEQLETSRKNLKKLDVVNRIISYYRVDGED
ncbi:homoserine dehydrogenase [Gracilibacillus halophilus YIM-C55.5]|uniref:Homoserine dehydrogenase n=1 Tax=Gracilibacillus halophilus YIM-C55.5 TaxID=1308866 RepID=N4WN58_9BACI|nr:homoserine dehydrogenase [Gracilibacillus halophilus]ENH95940.1 homoserine dehydrogenase [Gracilibacillus halophilus YIM-C55.5]